MTLYSKLLVANQILTETLESKKSFFIARAGATEMSAISGHSRKERFSALRKLNRRMHLWKYSGVFPPTKKEFSIFLNEYRSALKECDLLVDYPKIDWQVYLNDETKQIEKLPIEILDPVLLSSLGIQPWTLALKNKKVLIIHPQSELIMAQSKFAKTLHQNQVIPDCFFSSLTPPETNGFEISVSGSWNKELGNFRQQIREHLKTNPADIALVAAGAYGLPICAFLKQLGISSIYMGGSLQILFGIWGNRWRGKTEYLAMETTYWVQSNGPSIRGSKFVEGGAYW